MSSGPNLSIAPYKTADLQRLSPAALAYLGDAVYELHVRLCCLMPPKRIQAYHEQVVSQVRAETQARYLKHLEPYLTETEIDVTKRGRNAATRHPKRVDLNTYKAATSFETLLGYLYLTDRDRLTELLDRLKFSLAVEASDSLSDS